MKPSTTVRATRSRLEMDASTDGSRNRDMSGLYFGNRYRLQDFLQDVISAEPVGFSLEVEQHPVTENGACEGRNVVGGDMVAPLHERSGFGCQDEELRSPDAGAEVQVLLDDVGRS